MAGVCRITEPFGQPEGTEGGQQHQRQRGNGAGLDGVHIVMQGTGGHFQIACLYPQPANEGIAHPPPDAHGAHHQGNGPFAVSGQIQPRDQQHALRSVIHLHKMGDEQGGSGCPDVGEVFLFPDADDGAQAAKEGGVYVQLRPLVGKGQHVKGLGNDAYNQHPQGIAVRVAAFASAHHHAPAKKRHGQAADVAQENIFPAGQDSGTHMIDDHGDDGNQLQKPGVFIAGGIPAEGKCVFHKHCPFHDFAIVLNRLFLHFSAIM